MEEKLKTLNIGKPMIIAGIIVILLGVIFYLQSRAFVGPQSSFMYSNPQWTTYGQYIALVGVLIFAVGFVILKKKIRKRGKNMKNKNKLKKGSFWAGIIIVVGTHLYMLFAGLPQNQVIPHSAINIGAGGLLAYAWFGKK